MPAHLDQLQTRPTLFISVSLSAAYPDGLPEAQAYVDTFLETTKWKPTQTAIVAGAVRYDEYDYFMEQIVRHVVLKDRDAADAHGDHEFTDWDELARTIDGFLKTEAETATA